MSDVTLLINDSLYGGWEAVSIDLSIENLSSVFNLTLTDRWADQLDAVVIKPTDSCVVAIDGLTVITGYVDSVNLSIDANSHTIQVTGRDKTADIIDCSVINGTGQYKNLDLVQIATKICEPFDIKVSSDIPTTDIFPTFNIEQGATAFESIQKLCAARQCLAMSDGLGGVLITRAGNNNADMALIEGINIKSGTASYDNSLRFSKYIVKGQMQGLDTTTPETNAANMATSIDSGVLRYRPLVLVADGQANVSDCQKRADWERSTRAGRSRRFTIVTAGWLQVLNGKLWRINETVLVESDTLGVFDSLLIVGINYSLDNNGELTTLTLTSKDAYLTQPIAIVDAQANPYTLDDAEED